MASAVAATRVLKPTRTAMPPKSSRRPTSTTTTVGIGRPRLPNQAAVPPIDVSFAKPARMNMAESKVRPTSASAALFSRKPVLSPAIELLIDIGVLREGFVPASDKGLAAFTKDIHLSTDRSQLEHKERRREQHSFPPPSGRFPH